MKTQKELKKIYKHILETEIWQGDEKMVNHCLTTATYIVEFENGDIITIDKPSIEKNFCFGYSDSARDTESYDKANDMVHHASDNTNYFIEQNLKSLNKTIEQLKNGFDYGYEYYMLEQKYYGSPKDSKLKAIAVLHNYDSFTGDMRDPSTKLKGEDRQRAITGYEQVKAKFEKRLQSYLKRYGLSRVKTWSYWQDA